jgi:N-hydroxyarylamine O-acetyltransferase
MNVQTYLERIDYQGSLEPVAETLRDLQIAHLLAVPFENLSIHNHEPIVLDDEALFDKVVKRRRGGFCYELNGLFATLLRQLGFPVARLSAAVGRADGEFGPDFDHMTLLVTLKERWLVDVGFGDSFREPLLLDRRELQVQGERAYRIEEAGDYLLLHEKVADGDWNTQFRFTLQPYEYPDYLQMCHYHQTSPESHFTQNRICSRATPGGRVTLSNMRLIVSRGAARSERELRDEAEYQLVLEKDFGIDISKQ